MPKAKKVVRPRWTRSEVAILRRMYKSNSNAVIAVSAGNGVYQLGFNAEDCGRYLRTTWSATGANTNYDGIAAKVTVKRVY